MLDDTPLPGYDMAGKGYVVELTVPHRLHHHMFKNYEFNKIIKSILISSAIETMVGSDSELYPQIIMDKFEEKLINYRLSSVVYEHDIDDFMVDLEEYINALVVHIGEYLTNVLKTKADAALKDYDSVHNVRYDNYIVKLIFVEGN